MISFAFMKKSVCLLAVCCAACSLAAQVPVWNNPSVGGEGKADSRPEFISYPTREAGETGDPANAPHYVSLAGKWRAIVSTTRQGGEPGFYKPAFTSTAWQEVDVPNTSVVQGLSPLEALTPPQLPAEIPLVQYRAVIDVPYLWLDRDMFIHVEGVGGAYTVYVNDRRIGYSDDSRTPTEFPISEAVTDGVNTIGIEVYGYSTGNWMETLLPQLQPGSLGGVYVYSQPKLRIEDFVIRTQSDTTKVHGWVDFAVVMSNSYRSAEKITFGYDIYSPTGKLLTYNLIDTEIPGNSTDTLACREVLENIWKSTAWSPERPSLYKLMLYTRRDGRITEYIPSKFGFNHAELRDGELWINDKKAELSAVDYDAAADAAATERQLKILKNQRVNTLCVSYPQPHWFYELCDRIGFYVIDQANINAGFRKDDRNVGGSVANDPAFLPQFIDRVAGMQGRSKNYTSVIALSMGGMSGNGYNMYKAYQWLKGADSLHHVTYRDVQGEWNSDFPFPQVRDAKTLLDAAPAPAARSKTAVKPKSAARR